MTKRRKREQGVRLIRMSRVDKANKKMNEEEWTNLMGLRERGEKKELLELYLVRVFFTSHKHQVLQGMWQTIVIMSFSSLM